MTKEYVEQREEVYWIAGTRVSLDSIVYAFLEGMSPESILHCFPVLNLEQIYGAITFYLGHRAEIDDYLEKAKAEFAALQETTRQANPEFYKKLAQLHQQLQPTHQ